ncbi:hypothetical protein M885DRAFT_517228 [Pelagophyceae sp. CCMP2097]|nr:hypothetical protein M885DRAFT_517228 [Pelagophyceae sp. CCMP2097]
MGTNRFQRDKEEREKRGRDGAKEAAQVYEQFVASFDADAPKTFVRSSEGHGSGEPDKTYRPPKMKSRAEMAALMGGGDEEEPVAKAGPKARAIDSFLEELKTKQAAGGDDDVGEAHGSYGATEPKGSFDDGDPETTNLYVGNISPTITEEALGAKFGLYGQVRSVKIMWPRSDEERSRRRNCGFVSFEFRPDAAAAKDGLHDVDIDGYRITVGWGKAVKRAPGHAAMALPNAMRSTDAAGAAAARAAAAAISLSVTQRLAPPQAGFPPNGFPQGFPPQGFPQGGFYAGPPSGFPPSGFPPSGFPPSGFPPGGILTGFPPGGFPAAFPQGGILTGIPPGGFAPGGFATGGFSGGGVSAVDPVTGQPLGFSLNGQQQGFFAQPPGASPFFAQPPGPSPGEAQQFAAYQASANAAHAAAKELVEAAAIRRAQAGGVDRSMADADPRVQVAKPADPEVQELIDRLAEYVAKDGGPLEKLIRAREAGNARFSFLRQKSAEATYYRWRVYACLMDNELKRRDKARGPDALRAKKKLRTQPFLMQHDGYFWVPPPLVKGGDSEDESDCGSEDSRDKERRRKKARKDRGSESEESEIDELSFATGRQAEKARAEAAGNKKTRNCLAPDAADDLRTLLARVTCSRASIAEAMAFTLDNAASAADVADIIRTAVVSPPQATALALRAARLFLVSDILHNTSASVRGAQAYRALFQAMLPDAVDALRRAASAAPSRAAAQQLQQRVALTLATWLRWSLFPPLYVHGLEATFFTKCEDDDADPAEKKKKKADDHVEALRRRARQSGVPDVGAAPALERRLAHSRAFVKFRTLGAEPAKAAEAARLETLEKATALAAEPARAAAAAALAVPKTVSGAWAATATAEEEDVDGEDIDGEAMDDDEADLTALRPKAVLGFALAPAGKAPDISPAAPKDLPAPAAAAPAKLGGFFAQMAHEDETQVAPAGKQFTALPPWDDEDKAAAADRPRPDRADRAERGRSPRRDDRRDKEDRDKEDRKEDRRRHDRKVDGKDDRSRSRDKSRDRHRRADKDESRDRKRDDREDRSKRRRSASRSPSPRRRRDASPAYRRGYDR